MHIKRKTKIDFSTRPDENFFLYVVAQKQKFYFFWSITAKISLNNRPTEYTLLEENRKKEIKLKNNRIGSI